MKGRKKDMECRKDEGGGGVTPWKKEIEGWKEEVEGKKEIKGLKKYIKQNYPRVGGI